MCIRVTAANVNGGHVASPIIWYFVKFFKAEDEQYADAFMRGDMRLNRLSYFRDMEVAEDADDDGRPDRHEAVANWWLPDDVQFKLTAPGIGEVNIGPSDLAEPVYTSFEYHANLNILCLYAVRSVGFESIDGNIRFEPEQEAEVFRQLLVDERVFKFGEIAVVAHGPSFAAHMKRALQSRGQNFKGGLIEYYDESVSHSETEFERIPFRKQSRYSYQNEYRICVDTGIPGDSPLDISVGDISSFCAKVKSDTLNEVLKFGSRDMESAG